MFERATVTTTDHDASMAEGWRGGVLRSKTVAATEREVAELPNDVERSTEWQQPSRKLDNEWVPYSSKGSTAYGIHNNNNEDAIETREPAFQ